MTKDKIEIKYSNGLFTIAWEKNSLIWDEAYGYCKANRDIKWDSNSFVWYTKSAIVAFNCVDDFRKSFDCEVIINKDDEDLLNDIIFHENLNPPQRVNTNILNKILEEFPPWKGIGKYEDYQEYSIKLGIMYPNYLFDLPVGSGKSYIAGMKLRYLFTTGQIDSCLFVTSAEGVIDTCIKLRVFLKGILKEEEIVFVTSKVNRDIEKLMVEEKPKLIVSSYIPLRVIHKDLSKRKFKSTATNPKKQSIDFSLMGSKTILMLDECDTISNHKTQMFNAINRHLNCFVRRQGYSATMSLKFERYFVYLKLLNQDIITCNYSEFLQLIGNVGTDRSDFALESLRPERIKIFTEKVIQSYQYSVPEEATPKRDHSKKPLFISPSRKQIEIYRMVSEKVIEEARDKDGYEVKGNGLDYNKALLAVNDPRLLAERYLGNIKIRFNENPKVEACENLLDKWVKTQDKKVIIWMTKPDTMNSMADHFKKLNPICLHGSNILPKGMDKDTYRKQELDRFRNDPNCKLAILSQIAIQTNIDIVECHKQIYYNLGSIKEITQTLGRIDRGLMQKYDMETIFLIMEKTMDLFQWKQYLNGKDVSKALKGIKTFSLEDYQRVFNPVLDKQMLFES